MKDVKYIKRLTGGNKSAEVWLMTNNIVYKKYDMSIEKGRKLFQKEIKFLKHLEYCDFVPKLIKYNERKGSIYMTYVGERTPDTIENRKRLSELMKSLHLDWNLMRHRNNKPIYQRHINNCVIDRKNDKMYIIDFGTLHFKIIGPKIIK